MTVPITPARDVAGRLARVLTEVFSPAVLVAALLIVVGWHAGEDAGVSRWWGLPGALFAAAIPLAYVLRGVRRGHYANHHIPDREHRRTPLLVGLASGVAGTALLVLLGAPRDVLALLAAGIAGLLVFTTVTQWWKMSIHAGVAGGTAVVLTAVYGPWALTTLPLVAFTCWARLRLSAHTRAQVTAGAIVGALIAGTVFPAMR
ncbi:phosphoesterase PA-phosphatase [Mangrovihabitans endophyticus]|uniref:PAP2 superfamily protein n=1 Tax=Mangrovihabitans endophyticus TaxID=1751298 RepID=A0A8J3FRB1_9ACTN|nr:phosphoesterase PA-phosphatase [Mangrovihabitans endophyticus]GGL10086.1 hypothetical protein GCM10012284_51050 [Mangrovihabitans endophyticus]